MLERDLQNLNPRSDIHPKEEPMKDNRKIAKDKKLKDINIRIEKANTKISNQTMIVAEMEKKKTLQIKRAAGYR